MRPGGRVQCLVKQTTAWHSSSEGLKEKKNGPPLSRACVFWFCSNFCKGSGLHALCYTKVTEQSVMFAFPRANLESLAKAG